jgi:uncharacterized repeat protein (TIGR03803 family)
LPVAADPAAQTMPLKAATRAGPLSAQLSDNIASFKTLYAFRGPPDGASSVAPLINVDGTLYGTTQQGGVSNYGTVFKVTRSGVESVLYSFTGRGGDGGAPLAGLVNVNGTLYGTTFGGGTSGNGTVFTITPSGKERMLHSFTGSDGAEPEAGLTDVNGTLYGTTREGGPNSGDGTVFRITPSGVETVLHTFVQNHSDGFNPTAALVDLNGSLYGTTSQGGSTGGGTVFAITPAGSERVLYSFRGSNYLDGAFPVAALVNVNGSLFGTTNVGGSQCLGYGGCGTVFKITTAGVESVLHSFKGGPSGASPAVALLDVKGTLYGTTIDTVFKITMSGRETVLHRFTGTNGAYPNASLIDVVGALYGTTSFAGPGATGYGTVFSLVRRERRLGSLRRQELRGARRPRTRRRFAAAIAPPFPADRDDAETSPLGSSTHPIPKRNPFGMIRWPKYPEYQQRLTRVEKRADQTLNAVC